MISFKLALSSLAVLLAIGFCQPTAEGGTLAGADAKASPKVNQLLFTIEGMT